MPPLVLVEHVYKTYASAPHFEINRLFQGIARGLRQVKARSVTAVAAPHYVLNDVSFTLNAREALGVIGNNGAGKTTLFRLLSSISLPTRGRIRIEGRVSSLIALGAGFHPDLSGRENLYLNCALMGLSRQQTAGRIDQIVAFAELDAALDLPIKQYSSGMLARLGFSVAVHLDPELILVDEVLAVGDYRFQVKSTAALRDFIARGTVILVSHDMGAIERICPRAIWLEHGTLRMDGASSVVIPRYIASEQRALEESAGERVVSRVDAPSVGSGTTRRASIQQFDRDVQVRDTEVSNVSGAPCETFRMGDTLIVTCDLLFAQPMRDLRLVIGLLDTASQVVITSGDSQLADQPDALYGRVRVACRFPNILLRPRTYGIFVEVSNQRALMPLLIYKDLEARFTIIAERSDPAHHYLAPQADLLYTPGVELRFLEVERPISSA